MSSTEATQALLPVTREARSAAIEAERGVIFAARSMADRDCGATQTEMREAREAYMIDAFAKFERAVIERQSHSLPGDVGMREALEGLSLAADEINGDIDLQVNGDHSEEVDVNGEYYVTLSAAKVDALNKAICVAQRLLKQAPTPPANPAIEKILTLAKRKYHFQPTIGAVLRAHMPTGTTGHDWDDKEAFSQAIAILDLIPALAALTPSAPKDGFDREWCINMAKQEAGYDIGAGELAIDPFTPSALSEKAVKPGFQSEVGDWMLECFGPEIAADRLERGDRWTEEALELAQTIPGFTAERAHALVDYVFTRPAGERRQEVGGSMVTLAALCNSFGINIAEEAEQELARVWTKVDAIRAKQAAKPPGSALPVAVPSALSGDAGEGELRKALAKRTSMSTIAGGGQRPHVEIRFASLADAHALTDAILNRSNKEDDHGSRP